MFETLPSRFCGGNASKVDLWKCPIVGHYHAGRRSFQRLLFTAMTWLQEEVLLVERRGHEADYCCTDLFVGLGVVHMPGKSGRSAQCICDVWSS